MLEHEFVQEVTVGVEYCHHEPGPLESAKEGHVSLLGGAVAHAHHLFENARLSFYFVQHRTEDGKRQSSEKGGQEDTDEQADTHNGTEGERHGKEEAAVRRDAARRAN